MAKREALSLLDIAPRYEMVEISEDMTLRVTGLSVESIKILLQRFPALQGLMMGAGIDARVIMSLGPDIVGALCAAGTREIGKEEAEELARGLPVETQLDILEALGRCTFSKGFGPFAVRVMRIAGALSGQVGKAPDMTSPPPSNLSEEQPIPPSGN